MSEHSVRMTTSAAIAESMYAALQAADVRAAAATLAPDFRASMTEGLPDMIATTCEGPGAMVRDVWAAVATLYDLRPEPREYLETAEGVVVLGRYVGRARSTGRTIDAAFAHVIRIQDGAIAELRQYTDSHQWRQALQPK